jgi:hypothetical protein
MHCLASAVANLLSLSLLLYRPHALHALPNGVNIANSATAIGTGLRDALLASYDKRIPPEVPAPGKSTVRVQASLQSIVSLDTSAQTISINTWWRHYWLDPRLEWRPSAYGNIGSVLFPRSSIWMPDDVAYETLDSNLPILPDITVYSSGDIFYSQPSTLQFKCNLDLQNYPFDVQICRFTLGSWAMNGNDFDFRPKLAGGRPSPLVVDTFSQHTEFTLIAVRTEHVETFYSCCPEPYPVINFELTIRREPLSYIYSIIVPMILCTVVGFLGFLLNPSSGERIGLSITTLLTVVAIYFVAHGEIPKVGHWTVMSVLYMCSLALLLCLVATSVIVVSLYNVSPQQSYHSAEQLLALFDALDADESGRLSVMEIQNGMRSMGFDRRELQSVLRQVDRVSGKKDMGNPGHGSVTFADWSIVVRNATTRWSALQDQHNVVVGMLMQLAVRVAMALPQWCKGDPHLVREQQLQRRDDAVRNARDADGASHAQRFKATGGQVAPAAWAEEAKPGADKADLPPKADVAASEKKEGQRTGDKSAPRPMRWVREIQREKDGRDLSTATARRLAAMCDTVCCVLLPIIYLVVLIVYFGSLQMSSDGTITLTHVEDGVTFTSVMCPSERGVGFSEANC